MTDPWEQLEHALEGVQIDLDTADPGCPVPVPDGVLQAFCALYEARRARAAG